MHDPFCFHISPMESIPDPTLPPQEGCMPLLVYSIFPFPHHLEASDSNVFPPTKVHVSSQSDQKPYYSQKQQHSQWLSTTQLLFSSKLLIRNEPIDWETPVVTWDFYITHKTILWSFYIANLSCKQHASEITHPENKFIKENYACQRYEKINKPIKKYWQNKFYVGKYP